MAKHLMMAFACTILACSASVTTAAVLEPGSYILGNHPDGLAQPPAYGLRLDHLFEVAGNPAAVFTFDFEHPSSAVQMDFDGSTIDIHGTVFGGLVEGGAYAASFEGLWDIDFTYTGAVTAPGDDDFVILPPLMPNTGTITRLATAEVIDLFDEAGLNGFTFRLGDEDNDAGHRGFDGISGWGWLNQRDPNAHRATSDFLFTVRPIPEPVTGVLAGVGCLAIVLRRRRRAVS